MIAGPAARARRRARVRTAVAFAILGWAAARGARAQGFGNGRVALYSSLLRLPTADGGTSLVAQWSASLTLRSAPNADGGVEYAVEGRASRDFEGQHDTLSYLYNAYVGGRTREGIVGGRLGQMWLDELGSLGSVGGAELELRPRGESSLGRFRMGLFAGIEPKFNQVGWFDGVRKAGGFVALDGENARQSVLGYVQVRNQGILERSVVTLMNYLPLGKTVFIYQAGEYDLAKPGGQGHSGLNYLLVNARWMPVPKLELQGLYHYGRSIDARTITQDQIDGRPLDPRVLEGFLYESIGGRVTYSIVPTLRVFGGYAQEKRNAGDPTVDRITAGFFASDVFHSGFDVSVTDSRYHRQSGGDDDAIYASLGRSIGSRLYLTAEYSTSVAFLRLTSSGGIVVESRPRTQRYSLSGIWNISRMFSFLATLEHLWGEAELDRQDRGLFGLALRF